MEGWGVVSDLKHRVDLVCRESADPSPTHTQCGRIGVAFQVIDVALFLVNDDAVFIGTDIFCLGHDENAQLEANANLHLVFDAEAELKGNVCIVGVDFETLEIFQIGALRVLQRIGIRVKDVVVREVVVVRHAYADGYGVLFTFSKREIVGERPACALIEATRIPVVARSQLQVAEQVDAGSHFFVRLVGDELGKRTRRNN